MLLAQDLGKIHEALVRFHLTFRVIDQLIIQDEEAASNIKITLIELVPVFKLCSEGLEKVGPCLRPYRKGRKRSLNS